MHIVVKNFIERKETNIKWNNITLFPAIHYSMEFANLVRREVVSGKYDFIAVELPESLNSQIKKLVRFLPAHVVLRYPSSEGGYNWLVGENTDPFLEGIRSALEKNIDCACIDRDTEDYPAVFQPVPDTSALSSVETNVFSSLLLEQNLNVNEFVKHFVTERPELEILNREDEQRCKTMAWHLSEKKEEYKNVLFICGFSHINDVLEALETDPVRPLGRVRRDNVEILKISEEISSVVSETPAWFRKEYESFRLSTEPFPSRYEFFSSLLVQSAIKYKDEFKIDVRLASLRMLIKYSRNLALLSGSLFPEPWDIITAANGVVDHDFGYILHGVMTDLSEMNTTAAALEEAELTPEQLGKSSRTIQFHRRVLQRRSRMLSVVRTRPKEKFPGEWGNISDEDYICSYQPEDVVIENFGGNLAEKGRTLMGDLGKRTYPFSASLLDGINIKETLRNWHEGRVYVEENFSGKGKVGAVVLVYDTDDGSEEKYPYRMHWLGEHNQESDMAFYATMPGETMVGPGITRCEYGGMLLSWPPLRMWPVWEDPWLAYFGKKSSILLAAALQLTQERIVVYAAPSPPDPSIKRLAGRMGLKIVYLPLGTLPPDILRKTRHFHILSGKDTRKKAPMYILDD
ncbi:hypothetical protein KKF34_00465 [Myxococcota bacterium]|nr:hypothetical protein [Myxococcota bacterium]MBU1382024.1 hypothetical protein [Myxococcota bacterium]MBU1495334.1 hypothetical protein [Myxococcota bacterium]